VLKHSVEVADLVFGGVLVPGGLVGRSPAEEVEHHDAARGELAEIRRLREQLAWAHGELRAQAPRSGVTSDHPALLRGRLERCSPPSPSGTTSTTWRSALAKFTGVAGSGPPYCMHPETSSFKDCPQL